MPINILTHLATGSAVKVILDECLDRDVKIFQASKDLVDGVLFLQRSSRFGHQNSISLTSPSTTNLPSVFALISSTVTPGALSNNLKPSGVTSKTPRSVTIFFTQPTPVNGSVHFLKSLLSPALLVCI